LINCPPICSERGSTPVMRSVAAPLRPDLSYRTFLSSEVAPARLNFDLSVSATSSPSKRPRTCAALCDYHVRACRQVVVIAPSTMRRSQEPISPLKDIPPTIMVCDQFHCRVQYHPALSSCAPGDSGRDPHPRMSLFSAAAPSLFGHPPIPASREKI
jgi:hypothetical protein